MNELPQTSQAQLRGAICVLVALAREDAASCLESVQAHTPAEIPIFTVEPTAADVNRAIQEVEAADVAILDGACTVFPGWIERLRDAARADTNTATASALADRGTALALGEIDRSLAEAAELAGKVAERSLRLRPRLRQAVGPCVYVRREALELVGPLDERLELRPALELDFAQRCLLSGLAHVAGDDVLVHPLDSRLGTGPTPYGLALAESDVLAEALSNVADAPERLTVTIDARALDGAVTGTQVHILELINALARTNALELRVLVRTRSIDPETLARLRGLPGTEVLAEEELDETTPQSSVFHRPQQAFAAEDVSLAVGLGKHVVISQLDLIAYRNPGYFPDARAWEDYRRASRHGLAAAERVVVFSEHTRRELLSDRLVEDSQVRVVPPGLDHHAVRGDRRPREIEDEMGFLLCLGTDFRHKNRLFALRLLSALRADFGWSGKLVLAGTHVPHGSSLELEREYLNAQPDLAEAVLSLGSVDEQEKTWLLARAGAVVYPSTYEGFGLVPFESGLAGVPCLFAPQSSLAEAAPGETANVLAWDARASAAAAHELLSDGDARTRHVRALAEAARGLTWEKAAAELVEIYREAAGAPARVATTLSRDAVHREHRLTEAHEVVVARLIGEREHAQGMYDALNAEVGSGLGLIGPNGSLPDGLQRALLTISARPKLSRPLFGALAWVFLAGRMIGSRRRRTG